MLKKQLLSLILIFPLLFISFIAWSQEIDEQFIRQHLEKKQYQIDPDAAAIVLYEKATVHISEGINKYQKKYNVYRLVKILKQSAFNEGDIQYAYYDANSFVSTIEATTYNLEHDNIQKTSLEKSSVYQRNVGQNYRELKFALPAIREGSVIEYSYEVNTDMSLLMPSWFFQSDYPCLNSEYELIYPFRYQFMTITQSPHRFNVFPSRKDAIIANAEAYKVSNTYLNKKEESILWGRKNTAAAKEEPFISSIVNHTERLDIQLSAYADYSAINGIRSITSNWKKFTSELLASKEFGEPLSDKKSYLDPIVASLTKNADSDINKARAIFNYCRNNFQCTDTITYLVERNLKTVFTSKQGNIAEINILLISMLKKAGFNAAPVILSTLGQLKADDTYPMINRFNHVVCLLYMGNNRYLLDASNKYNPFGILPVYCYNGYARIMDKEKADSINIDSDMLKNKQIVKVNIYNITDTSIDVKVTEIQGMISSRITRRHIDGNEQKKRGYIHGRILDDENTVLTSFAFESIDNADTNLTVTYTLHKRFKQPSSTIYLETDYIKYFEESPFKSMQRKLPVELPFQMDYIYSLNLELPDNYKPESLPQPAMLTFEGGQLSFKHLAAYSPEVKLLTVTTRFTSNKTFFPVSNYDVIRQFFEKMIYETNQKITLKKS